MSHLIYQQLETNSDSTQNSILSAEEKMKAVCVDSLLNEFENGLGGARSDSGKEKHVSKGRV